MWRLTSHRPVTPLHSSWQETVDSLYPYHLLPRDEDSLARLLDLLDKVTCGVGYPKDFALVDIVREAGLDSLYLQPNIVKHIGAVSSLANREMNSDY